MLCPINKQLKDRVATLLGRDLASGLLPVHATAESTELSGFVAHPRFAKPTSKRQYFYLNGRHLRDKLLVAAIREGFSGYLEPRQHGSVMLWIPIRVSLMSMSIRPNQKFAFAVIVKFLA